MIVGSEAWLTRTRGRISYNALARLVGRGLGGLASLFALHIGTHYFGPDRWAPIVAALAFISIFSSVSDFGIQSIISRDIAVPSANASALFGAALAAVPIVTVPAVILAVSLDFAVYADHPEIRTLVLILLATIPLTAVWLVSCSVFVARSRSDVRALLDVASSLLGLGAIGIVAWTRSGADGYTALVSIAIGATAIVAVVLSAQYIRPIFARVGSSAIAVVKRSAPLGISYASNAIYGQVDTVLVALLASSTALAAFGVASQVASFVASVPAMLMVAATPHYMRQTLAGRQVLIQRTFDVLVTVAAIVPLLALLFAHGMVNSIAGARYSSGSLPLVLLLAASALAFPSAVFSQGLVLVGAQRAIPRSVAAALSVNIVGNVIAIPLDGITGASLVMIASEVTVLLVMARSFRVAAGFLPSLRRSIIAVGAAGLLATAYAMFDVFLGLRSGHGLTMVPELLFVIACYLALVAATEKVLSNIGTDWSADVE